MYCLDRLKVAAAAVREKLTSRIRTFVASLPRPKLARLAIWRRAKPGFVWLLHRRGWRLDPALRVDEIRQLIQRANGKPFYVELSTGDSELMRRHIASGGDYLRADFDEFRRGVFTFCGLIVLWNHRETKVVCTPFDEFEKKLLA